MKVATLSGISDVKCRMALEPGHRVHIAMSGIPVKCNSRCNLLPVIRTIWFTCLLLNHHDTKQVQR